MKDYFDSADRYTDVTDAHMVAGERQAQFRNLPPTDPNRYIDPTAGAAARAAVHPELRAVAQAIRQAGPQPAETPITILDVAGRRLTVMLDAAGEVTDHKAQEGFRWDLFDGSPPT